MTNLPHSLNNEHQHNRRPVLLTAPDDRVFQTTTRTRFMHCPRATTRWTPVWARASARSYTTTISRRARSTSTSAT